MTNQSELDRQIDIIMFNEMGATGWNGSTKASVYLNAKKHVVDYITANYTPNSEVAAHERAARKMLVAAIEASGGKLEIPEAILEGASEYDTLERRRNPESGSVIFELQKGQDNLSPHLIPHLSPNNCRAE